MISSMLKPCFFVGGGGAAGAGGGSAASLGLRDTLEMVMSSGEHAGGG